MLQSMANHTLRQIEHIVVVQHPVDYIMTHNNIMMQYNNASHAINGRVLILHFIVLYLR